VKDMKIVIVGEKGRPHALAEALETGGVDVERPPKSAFGAADDDQVGELAAALIAFDGLFADDAPDAVLLVSTSNLALAAVLVATKLQIPVAALVEATRDEGRLSDMNWRLVEQLADGTVTGDAETIAASLRALIAA
jgi:UDP-N-acetylglucosamine 2-epimerase